MGLAGCSSVLDALPDGGEPPVILAVATSIREAAKEAKLLNPLEVAGPIRANQFSSFPWIICLRTHAPGILLNPPYALFLKDDKLVTFRMTAIVDQCDSQNFVAL